MWCMADTKSQIEAFVESLGLSQVRHFQTDILDFSYDMRHMCDYNTCGRFAKTWNCPPGVGDFEDLIGLCKSFSKGTIFNEVSDIEDSFDFEGMMAAGHRLFDKLMRINDYCRQLLVEDGQEAMAGEANVARIVVHNQDTALAQIDINQPYRVFGSDSCNSCAQCTYPGHPCVHPENFFIPLEACGINVTVLSKQLGMNYSAGQNTVTFFGMLLYL